MHLARWMCWIGALPLAAGSLADAERSAAVARLQQSRQAFLEAVTGLSAAQLRFRPAPDAWSVLQVAEHVAVSEDRIFAHLEKLLTHPSTAARAKRSDDEVWKRETDRTKKMKTSADLEPSGRWATLSAVLDHFEEARARTLRFTRETRADLRSHLSATGDTDAYQQLLIIASHTLRHVEQIREIQAHPAYPKPPR